MGINIVTPIYMIDDHAVSRRQTRGTEIHAY